MFNPFDFAARSFVSVSRSPDFLHLNYSFAIGTNSDMLHPPYMFIGHRVINKSTLKHHDSENPFANLSSASHSAKPPPLLLVRKMPTRRLPNTSSGTFTCGPNTCSRSVSGTDWEDEALTLMASLGKEAYYYQFLKGSCD